MSTAALDRAVQVLGLSDAEVVAIFHVSPAELAAWRKAGVPAQHAGVVSTVEDVAKRLAVWLDPGQLRHAIRQPRSRLGGRSLLQVLAENGPDAVHAEVDRMLASGQLP